MKIFQWLDCETDIAAVQFNQSVTIGAQNFKRMKNNSSDKPVFGRRISRANSDTRDSEKRPLKFGEVDIWADMRPYETGTIHFPGPHPRASILIYDRLRALLDINGRTEMGDFISIAGSLGGFACQQAVWRACIEPQNRNAGDYLLQIGTINGDVYYFGETINTFLSQARFGKMTFYSGAAGAMAPDFSALPDIRELHEYVTKMVGPEYGSVRLPKRAGHFVAPYSALTDHWGWTEKVLLESENPPGEWPAILGFVAQFALKGAAECIPLQTGLRLLMEAAIFMSKVDPRKVPGATAGLNPPLQWSFRHSHPEFQKLVVEEVYSLMPTKLPR